MTREQADARAAELNAEPGAAGHWMAQEAVAGEWRLVRLSVAGLEPRRGPLTATTEAAPRPFEAPDPRPANVRNIPPFGAGV
jgi:hypothetical protein